MLNKRTPTWSSTLAGGLAHACVTTEMPSSHWLRLWPSLGSLLEVERFFHPSGWHTGQHQPPPPNVSLGHSTCTRKRISPTYVAHKPRISSHSFHLWSILFAELLAQWQSQISFHWMAKKQHMDQPHGKEQVLENLSTRSIMAIQIILTGRAIHPPVRATSESCKTESTNSCSPSPPGRLLGVRKKPGQNGDCQNTHRAAICGHSSPPPQMFLKHRRRENHYFHRLGFNFPRKITL